MAPEYIPLSYPELGPLSGFYFRKKLLELGRKHIPTIFRSKLEQSSGWFRDGLVLSLLKRNLMGWLNFLVIKVFVIIK